LTSPESTPALAGFVDVLEQFLPRQVAHALQHPGQAAVAEADVVAHAALALEVEIARRCP
jgi:hypothetical protein